MCLIMYGLGWLQAGIIFMEKKQRSHLQNQNWGRKHDTHYLYIKRPQIYIYGKGRVVYNNEIKLPGRKFQLSEKKKKIPEGKECTIVLSLAVSSEVQSKLKLWEKTILHPHLSSSWNHGFRLYDLKSWKPWSFQYNMAPLLHRWSTTVLMLIPYIYILFHSLERAFTFTPQRQPLWWQNHNTFTQLVVWKTLSHTVILQKRSKEVEEEEMAGKGPGQPGDSLQSIK